MYTRLKAIALLVRSTLVQLMERLRKKLFPPTKQFRVYLSFVRNTGRWYCRFHEGNIAKTPISRRFVFADVEKIYETARRAHGIPDPASRRALDEAVAKGCGGVWLGLSEEQLVALLQASKRAPA